MCFGDNNRHEGSWLPYGFFDQTCTLSRSLLNTDTCVWVYKETLIDGAVKHIDVYVFGDICVCGVGGNVCVRREIYICVCVWKENMELGKTDQFT